MGTEGDVWYLVPILRSKVGVHFGFPKAVLGIIINTTPFPSQKCPGLESNFYGHTRQL